ncbi:MAG: hypothetical protein HKO59_00910 [Phycisphaerales bacterium]|nr:hypothetical protein [Phycisphaerae bacterium]NNF41775.1 hypothetical protein [Phycisphaerales bacterium]NNM24539.1 hypothetical protein [Phycisphaerales bacterium]
MSPAPLIICPLHFERAHLRRRLPPSWTVCVGGRGASSITRWVERQPEPAGPVVLAGLAGALTVGVVDPGQAATVSHVRAPEGGSWRPTWPASPSTGCVATSVEAMLTTPADRVACHTATGADLVDEESVAFARSVTERGWSSWGIVRGVSDAADTRLPPGVSGWVGEDGRTRGLRVALTVMRHPGAVVAMGHLRTSSRGALDAVARLLVRCAGA